jgi:hypothetical protein
MFVVRALRAYIRLVPALMENSHRKPRSRNSLNDRDSFLRILDNPDIDARIQTLREMRQA